MANKSSIFKVRIDMSNIDQHRYEQLCFTAAKSFDENYEHFVMRLLAYAMLPEERLSFGSGVCSGVEPDVMVRDYDDHFIYWVDIGYPSCERIKKASQQADHVVIFSLNGTEWLQEHQWQIMQHKNVQLVLLAPDLITPLQQNITRAIDWSLVVDGSKIGVCDHYNYWESDIVKVNNQKELVLS